MGYGSEIKKSILIKIGYMHKRNMRKINTNVNRNTLSSMITR